MNEAVIHKSLHRHDLVMGGERDLVLLADWIDVDLFAGGGGASTGMEWALGKSPDIAINHDFEALAMHMANHPRTLHLCQNLVQVHPHQATAGRKVNVLWASPDCKHFSKAKGGKPRDQFIRDLAWVVIRWAEETRPRFIFVENVEEFQTWGPLDQNRQPVRSQSGTTFRSWIKRLRRLGYRVDWRELRACDYGAPTTRKRLFIVARCDGKKICWPKATHGPGTKRPWRTAAACIDWNDRAPSIFERKKPLALNTQRRIAEGIRRYVLKAEKPFLVTYCGPKKKNDFRGQPLDEPLRTQTTENRHALVSACLLGTGGPAYAGEPTAIDKPCGTILGKNTKALAAASLVNGRSECQPLDDPVPTLLSENKMGLVQCSLTETSSHYTEVRDFLREWQVIGQDKEAVVVVDGITYLIDDIGLRMLRPRELFTANGFPASYVIDPVCNGKPLSITSQVKKCGNSVPPEFAHAIIAANHYPPSDKERVSSYAGFPLLVSIFGMEATT